MLSACEIKPREELKVNMRNWHLFGHIVVGDKDVYLVKDVLDASPSQQL